MGEGGNTARWRMMTVEAVIVRRRVTLDPTGQKGLLIDIADAPAEVQRECYEQERRKASHSDWPEWSDELGEPGTLIDIGEGAMAIDPSSLPADPHLRQWVLDARSNALLHAVVSALSTAPSPDADCVPVMFLGDPPPSFAASDRIEVLLTGAPVRVPAVSPFSDATCVHQPSPVEEAESLTLGNGQTIGLRELAAIGIAYCHCRGIDRPGEADVAWSLRRLGLPRVADGDWPSIRATGLFAAPENNRATMLLSFQLGWCPLFLMEPKSERRTNARRKANQRPNPKKKHRHNGARH